jgi:hypothetical protein
MVWIELSACEIHFGASTKFLDYRVYVRYDMQAQDETSHIKNHYHDLEIPVYYHYKQTIPVYYRRPQFGGPVVSGLTIPFPASQCTPEYLTTVHNGVVVQ